MAKKYRVVQFGTGFVGHLALRAIIAHPDLELVGVWVHGQDKVGMDAGTLAGLDHKTGIKATNDIDAIIALKPDCISSGAGADGREDWMANAHSRFLAAGINMVSSSISGLVNPDAHVDRAMISMMNAAAMQGGASYFSSGIEPGFMSDTLPLTLSGISQNWKSIRVQEILDYSTWIPNEVEKLMGDVLGFGRPMDYVPLLFQPGHLTYVWGGPITLMARALGVTLDEVREKVWRHPANESFEVKGFQTIEKGTAEAFRFELQGIVDGREAIVLEHVTRLRPGTAMQWDSGRQGDGYYVYIEGDPRMTLHMTVTGPDGDHHTGGILATATRLVNAIPLVCDAKAGLITPLDMPMIIGRGLYHPHATGIGRSHKVL